MLVTFSHVGLNCGFFDSVKGVQSHWSIAVLGTCLSINQWFSTSLTFGHVSMRWCIGDVKSCGKEKYIVLNQVLLLSQSLCEYHHCRSKIPNHHSPY